MAHVQYSSMIDFTSTTTKQLALGSALGTGNTLIVVVAYFHDIQRNVQLSDTAGHSFTQVSTDGFPFYNATDDVGLAAFYVPSTIAGSDTLTATFINTVNGLPDTTESGGAILAIEESQLLTSGPYLTGAVQRVASPGTGTGAVTPGNANITSQPAIVYGVAFNNANESAPTAAVGTSIGTAFVDSGSGFGRVSRARVTSTGNYASTFTVGSGQGGNTHYAMQLAFIEDAGGSSSTQAPRSSTYLRMLNN